jgi:glycosyltransferase involved in cell wall biosynthesis
MPPSVITGAITRQICRRAALVVGNSAATTGAFVKGGCSAKIRVVHSPVDLSRFMPERHECRRAREALSLPESAPILATIGQITPWKAQDDAIRIAAALIPRFPDIRLLIVGEPRFTRAGGRHDNLAYERQLRDLAKTLSPGFDVRFLGQRDDIPMVLSATDVVLAPSWHEPFGRSIVEAMAMGKAVVASSSGGPPEIISDGVNGYLRAPRHPDQWLSAVTNLLEDPSLRGRIGDAARERADAFRLERHVAAVDALYAELVSRSGLVRQRVAEDNGTQALGE